MPDGHRRAMPQVTAVDDLFGTPGCGNMWLVLRQGEGRGVRRSLSRCVRFTLALAPGSTVSAFFGRSRRGLRSSAWRGATMVRAQWPPRRTSVTP
jgi:hypothetical protein